jgi:hypothetical protein
MPGQAVIDADPAALIHSHDEGDDHIKILTPNYTAMGALIVGWYW